MERAFLGRTSKQFLAELKTEATVEKDEGATCKLPGEVSKSLGRDSAYRYYESVQRMPRTANERELLFGDSATALGEVDDQSEGVR